MPGQRRRGWVGALQVALVSGLFVLLAVRLLHRKTNSAPWSPSALPKHLRALEISEQAWGSQAVDARVLSWRKIAGGERALIVSAYPEGAFRVVIASHADDVDRWYLPNVFHGPSPELRLEHRPSDAELSHFAVTYWGNGGDNAERWAMDPEAWKWAVGAAHPVALEAELERVQRYGEQQLRARESSSAGPTAPKPSP